MDKGIITEFNGVTQYLTEDDWFSKFAKTSTPPTGKFIAKVYRCEEYIQTLDHEYGFDSGRDFYFCDDPRTWTSPWMSNETIAIWEIEFYNPLYITDLPTEILFEVLINNPMFKKLLEDHAYDAVLYQGDGTDTTDKVKQGVLIESVARSQPKRI